MLYALESFRYSLYNKTYYFILDKLILFKHKKIELLLKEPQNLFKT